MAATTLTGVKAPYNAITEVTMTNGNTTDGCTWKAPVNQADEYVFFLVQNADASAQKLTVVKPAKGGYAAAASNLEKNITASGLAVVRVETAKYAENDGTITIKSASANLKVAAVY